MAQHNLKTRDASYKASIVKALFFLYDKHERRQAESSRKYDGHHDARCHEVYELRIFVTVDGLLFL